MVQVYPTAVAGVDEATVVNVFAIRHRLLYMDDCELIRCYGHKHEHMVILTEIGIFLMIEDALLRSHVAPFQGQFLIIGELGGGCYPVPEASMQASNDGGYSVIRRKSV